MSEQEKKYQRNFDLIYAEIKPMFLFLPSTKQRNFLTKT